LKAANNVRPTDAAVGIRGSQLPSLQHQGVRRCLEASRSFQCVRVTPRCLFIVCLAASTKLHTQPNSVINHVSALYRSYSISYLPKSSDSMAEPQPGKSLSADLSNLAMATTQPELLGLRYLPVELLDAIVAFLDHKSLCALVLTCKATKNSASQALYATYINREAPSKRPFHLFLRTLCESTELAAMVKILDIRGWRSEWETATGIPWAGVTMARETDRPMSSRIGPEFASKTGPAKKVTEPLRLFEETAIKLGLILPPLSSSTPALQKSITMGSTLAKDEDFVRLLRHNVEDAQVVLMLALLPGLLKLCVDGMPPFPTLDWYHFLKPSASAPRRLSEFYIYGHPHKDGRSLYTMNAAFLELVPGLQRLFMTNIYTKSSRHVKNVLSDKKLQHYIALGSEISPTLLQTMLSGQRLTKFRYRPAPGDMSEDQEEKYSEDRIVDSLKDSLQSLRDLTLFSMRPSFSSRIAQFGNLKRLEMPWQYGFFTCPELDPENFAEAFRRRIPSSLSTIDLCFLTPTEDVPVAMETLANLKNQGEFANLKSIRLSFRQYSIPPWHTPIPYANMVLFAEERFGETLRNAGLQLELAQPN
jgi:hypothetical protein